MKQPQVILVNEKDEQTGVMDKMEAHRSGTLHRAFSIFIFDSGGRMLLQKRAPAKYHGGDLWTNACCSHPYPGESTEDAATRRLEEELGFITGLRKIFSFTYQSMVENGLVEHEYDHVFAGQFEGDIFPNDGEVAAIRYMEMKSIKTEMERHPEHFTSWFKIAYPKIETWWKERFRKEIQSSTEKEDTIHPEVNK